MVTCLDDLMVAVYLPIGRLSLL